MAETSNPALNPIPLDAQSRRWALRLVTILTAIEALLLAGLSIGGLLRFDWEEQMGLFFLPDEAADALAVAVIFLPLAFLTVLVLIGLLFGKRTSWTFAMLVQGLILAACLMVYLAEIRPYFLYLFMLYAILLVFYLNSSDVRMAFFARTGAEDGAERDH